MAAWEGVGGRGVLAGWVEVLGLVTCCSSWSPDLGGLLSGQSQLAGPPLHSLLTTHPRLHLKHEGQGWCNPDLTSPPSLTLFDWKRSWALRGIPSP